ncbi:hypothetical protein RDWZM_004756 [Blomia tropicalis]|uniref:Uncharacterized protein n=1 Tax=Blomia tropicalis TaxID=40697 RepID=A0A9Q0M4U8_BLOTA|nr:hypothetical protein RDWZM_004756 [Blomia tropicalis]
MQSHTFIIILLHVLIIVYTEDPCKKISNSDGSNLTIRCIGKLKSNIILITEDWLVYDLPYNSLSATLNTLYIGNNTPIPIEEKWPNMVKTKYFKIAHAHFYNSFTVTNFNGTEYFFITTKYKKCSCSGVIYDITNDITFEGRYYPGDSDQVLLSSRDIKRFYSLDKLNKQLYILQYYFERSDVAHSAIVPTENGTARVFCGEGNDKIMVARTRDITNQQCEKVEWPVLNGFVTDGKIYLFGPNYIIKFPEKVYTERGQSVNVERIPFNKFIQCGGSVDIVNPRDVRATKSPPLLLILIIIIILLILLICLCCLLCLMREAEKRRKKGKQSKSGGGGGNERSDTAGPFGILDSINRSVRSGKVPSISMLSKNGPAPASRNLDQQRSARSASSPIFSSLTKRMGLSSNEPKDPNYPISTRSSRKSSKSTKSPVTRGPSAGTISGRSSKGSKGQHSFNNTMTRRSKASLRKTSSNKQVSHRPISANANPTQRSKVSKRIV